MESEITVTTNIELKKLMRETIRQELNNHTCFAPPVEILNTEDLASFLKVSKQFIIKLRKKGLPFYTVGTAIRYKRSDIMAYIDKFKKIEGDSVSRRK